MVPLNSTTRWHYLSTKISISVAYYKAKMNSIQFTLLSLIVHHHKSILSNWDNYHSLIYSHSSILYLAYNTYCLLPFSIQVHIHVCLHTMICHWWMFFRFLNLTDKIDLNSLITSNMATWHRNYKVLRKQLLLHRGGIIPYYNM